MTARYNWTDAWADMYANATDADLDPDEVLDGWLNGAYYTVSTTSYTQTENTPYSGLISQFDLYFSPLDFPDDPVSEFLTSTEDGSLSAIEESGVGCVMIGALAEAISSDETWVSYYAVNVNTSDPTLIPSTTAVGFEEMTVYVSYPAADGGGANPEISALEKKYNPYIAEGYSPAEAYQSAVDGLTNQALALTPTSM